MTLPKDARHRRAPQAIATCARGRPQAIATPAPGRPKIIATCARERPQAIATRAARGRRHDGADRRPRPVDRVRQPRRADPGARPRVVSHRARGNARAGRRVGLRQVGDGASDHAHPAAQRDDHVRRDPVHAARREAASARHRARRPRRTEDAAHSRPPHLDDLPGADGLAVAAAHDRRPGQRGAVPAPQGRASGGDGADAGHAAARRLSRSGARAADVSVPALGRAAPARDDRDGAGLPAVAPDRGRADDRARRHDPGADPRARQGAAGRARDGGADHHARPRRRRQRRRRGRRAVCGARDGARADRGAVRTAAASVSARAAARGSPFRHEARRAPRVGAQRRAPDRPALRNARAVARRCRDRASRGAQPREDVRAALDRLPRAARGPEASRGRRRHARDPPRRVLRPRRRERLRQDDAVEADHARARAGQRRRALRSPSCAPRARS